MTDPTPANDTPGKSESTDDDIDISPASHWGTPSPDGRDAVPGAPGLYFASTPTRVVAYLIDIVILFMLGIVVRQVMLAVSPIDPYAPGTPTNVAAVLIDVVIDVAYFVGFWTSRMRATPGQMVFRLQVGNAFDGRTLTRSQGILRWIALGEWISILLLVPAIETPSLLLSLAWFLVLLVTTVASPTKQGWHDRWANSAVVSYKQGTSPAVVTCLVVALILPLLAIVAAAALYFMGTQISEILHRIGTDLQ